jgi:hypothetical protein
VHCRRTEQRYGAFRGFYDLIIDIDFRIHFEIARAVVWQYWHAVGLVSSGLCWYHSQIEAAPECDVVKAARWS